MGRIVEGGDKILNKDRTGACSFLVSAVVFNWNMALSLCER